MNLRKSKGGYMGGGGERKWKKFFEIYKIIINKRTRIRII